MKYFIYNSYTVLIFLRSIYNNLKFKFLPFLRVSLKKKIKKKCIEECKKRINEMYIFFLCNTFSFILFLITGWLNFGISVLRYIFPGLSRTRRFLHDPLEVFALPIFFSFCRYLLNL